MNLELKINQFRNTMHLKARQLLVFTILVFTISCNTKQSHETWNFSTDKNEVEIDAGILKRRLSLNNTSVLSDIYVEGTKLTKEPIPEFSVRISKASPNQEPEGINFSEDAGINQEDSEKNMTDALMVNKKENSIEQAVSWINPVETGGLEFKKVFNSVSYKIETNERKNKQLVLTLDASKESDWKGLSLEIIYEIFNQFPAIRKQLKFINHSENWIKIDELTLDDIQLSSSYLHYSELTPPSKGIDPSIISFSDSIDSKGLIIGSEVPSKLRKLSKSGINAYNPDYFEWILGPSESFESEPVITFAFSGDCYSTESSISTALDRCVESNFQSFLNKHILRNPNTEIPAPLFCTWTNYADAINDSNMRIAADIAAKIGFKCFQLDAGWSDTGENGGWAVSTTQPDTAKFPDLNKICDFFQSKGMKAGLWYSVFLNEKLVHENEDISRLVSLPLIRRAGGLGLSFCNKASREKYAGEITFLNKKYGAEYFKQDLSNLCYGDIARGHESRTQKESYLRGLRGLLATQDEIHRQAPSVWLQLSHEIYWETPGPKADIAVLKHVDSYHAAPNEYWGAGHRKQLVNENWRFNADSLQQKLIQGAFRARDLLYKHRGLPLDRIEVFGAASTNYNGSLSPDIQDRQVCSWLMGAPLSFSGDLSSLSNENIERYANRFKLLAELQDKYQIFQNFEFSGVPDPTDEDWHWWGKLNSDGCGVVVVLRGSKGENQRKINIPWVHKDRKYKVRTLFSRQVNGNYIGEELQNGQINIELPVYGQDLIEIELN